MKQIALFSLLALLLLSCKDKPEEFKIEAPRSIQILDRPMAGITPPFTYTKNGIDKGCVASADSLLIWEKAPDDLSGKFERNISNSINALFQGEFSEKVALSANIAVSTLNNLKYTVKAHGVKVFRVDFTKVNFTIGETCLDYLESFERNDSKLAIEAYKADSVVITYTDSIDNKLEAALKAGFTEKYKIDISTARSLTGGLNYTIKGSDLVFGYYPASFKVDLFSYKRPLKLKIPVGELVEVNQEWIKSLSIEEVGDDKSYLVRLNPKVGKQKMLRMSKLEQSSVDIDYHQKLTVSIDKIKKGKAYLTISGFSIKAI